MKRIAAIIFVCLAFSAVFTACGSRQAQTSQTTAIGNPWANWDTMEEAEAAAGFSFGLPEVIADSYSAVAFRTLNNELIEVIYRHEDAEVRVRKQKGEDQDISGDYNQYDTCTETNFGEGILRQYQNADDNAIKQVISLRGYSWSLTAPQGYPGASGEAFLHKILGE